MSMTQLIGKGLLAGSIVVAASEIAKRSALFGALVVSLPLTSILAMMALYQDLSLIHISEPTRQP